MQIVAAVEYNCIYLYAYRQLFIAIFLWCLCLYCIVQYNALYFGIAIAFLAAACNCVL